MEMGSWIPMPKVTSLTMFTDMRDMSSCADNVSMEECQTVVLGSKWHNWFYSDLMYGQNSIIFLCVGLGVFTLTNIVFHLRRRTFGRQIGDDPMYLWIAGLGRYATSRQLRLSRRRGYSLTLGQSVTIGIIILFFTVMTLGPQPYYWPNPVDFGGSPPIATRSGFMAIAILPFQVLLATKWNLITCLTGVSHEKLQVYHRWMGWIMYVLALIHTFPFIVVDFQTGNMAMLMKSDWYTVSGIICLVPQTLLVSLSLAPIRNRAYELFKGIHFVLAAFFIVFLFLHCGFTLTSALYFVGFAAAYAFSWLARFLIIVRNGVHTASITSSPYTSLLHLSIPTTNTRLRWEAGQHYFVRFITKDAHMLTSHPFTVASAPGDGAMEFIIKPAKGMTAALHAKVEERGLKDVKVVLDGPYGGTRVEVGGYDRVLLVAGGSGISFLLGTLRHLLHRQSEMACKQITVVYTCRTSELAEHYRAVLSDLTKQFTTSRVEVYCHLSSLSTTSPDFDPEQASKVPEKTPITTETGPVAAASDAAAAEAAKLGAADCCCGPEITPVDGITSKEKAVSDDSYSISDYSTPSLSAADAGEKAGPLHSKTDEAIALRAGRPEITQHIGRIASYYGTAAVAICGPKELVYDARNAVAQEQLKIVRGDIACTDLYLHTEVFEW